ncbi:hypothetical protein THRCLA_06375 [Thraustotheca clavata]|uniref:Uncharacterized protein n=1 Tax=Thraustotheca clavata TaxID=74557 RepID=A0A1V9ZPC1_9STRA|nr:hypothetical protein THRCLA_06375 [Thraustotheca clavata]
MVKKEEAKEVIPVVIEPEKPKIPPGRELVNSLLTQEDTEALLALVVPNEQVECLTRLLKIEHYDKNPRSRAYVDLCFYNLLFCKEAAFDVDKTALLFAIMGLVLEHATTNLVTLQENYQVLTGYLKKHSVDMPPDNVEIFTLSDVQRIINYLTTTYYQHFQAYQAAFHDKPDFVRVTRHIVVETPVLPVPMVEAIELKKYGANDPLTVEPISLEEKKE